MNKMPMGKDPKTGKMVPKFAMDGKGKMAKGGSVKMAKGGSVKMAKGGCVKMAGGGMMAKGYKIGGKVATKGGTKGGVSGGTKVTRADGIAKKGKTKGRMV